MFGFLLSLFLVVLGTNLSCYFYLKKIEKKVKKVYDIYDGIIDRRDKKIETREKEVETLKGYMDAVVGEDEAKARSVKIIYRVSNGIKSPIHSKAWYEDNAYILDERIRFCIVNDGKHREIPNDDLVNKQK